MSNKDMCEDCAFKDKCEKYKECLNLKEKLDVAVKALNDAGNYLVCMDELYELTGECNEQMALEIINKALEKIKEIN